MTIARFYNNLIVIRRQQTSSGFKTHEVSTGTYDAHIQRIDESSNSSAFSVYGATHRGFCDLTNDIKKGDIITDQYGTRFSVEEVIIEGLQIAENEHMELILKEYTS